MIILDVMGIGFGEEGTIEYSPLMLFFNMFISNQSDEFIGDVDSMMIETLRKEYKGSYRTFGRKHERLPFFRWLIYGLPEPKGNSLVYDWSFELHSAAVQKSLNRMEAKI